MLAIDLNHLQFSYPGATSPQLVIEKWQIAQNEQVFLFGPSGSGKSTLLNLLTGTLKPSSGEIRLLEQPFSILSARKRDKFRAKHIGVVFQQFNLIHYLTVQENIELAAYFATERNDNLNDLMQDLFEQLGLSNQLFGRTVSELSVGQQQRVAIARALINEPEILIVDEPTSALDEDARDSFMSLLMRLVERSGATLVFVSHDKTLRSYFSKSLSINELQGLGVNA